jgi:hypothetical protein
MTFPPDQEPRHSLLEKVLLILWVFSYALLLRVFSFVKRIEAK